VIHVVARSSDHLALFNRRHEQLYGRVQSELGQTSFFALLNSVIATDERPYVCLVHDDVTFGSDFASRVESLISRLNRDWPNWGVVGNTGLLSFRFGFDPTGALRYVADPHHGPNLQGHVLPAQSIDGNTMLLNVRALRQRGVVLPDWNGFQLYDIVLSIETIRAGLGVLVAPELACWHGSGGSQDAFDSAAASEGFRDYLSRRVTNRIVKTLNGEVCAGLKGTSIGRDERVDLDLDSLRSAASQRPPRTVAICIRTQFKRPLLLRRTLETTSAFVVSAGGSTRFVVYILTDKPEREPDFVADHADVVTMTEEGGSDSRNQLVRHAANNIDADWFWFVDDDDWLFPNEAERLGLVLNVIPLHSTILLDTQHFEEKISEKDTAIGGSYRGKEARLFPAQDFAKSLGGQNYIPMCGMIVSRQVLKAIPNFVYDRVIYYDDFSLLLHALLSPDVLPIVVDRLYAGISLREFGNSVSETDQAKWDMSMGNLVASITCSAPAGALMTMPVQRSQPLTRIEPLMYLSDHERLIVLLWRAARATARLSISPKMWRIQSVTLIKTALHEGPRGALRVMAHLGRRRVGD
jgi:GT2 family glycosyltransferase